MKTVNGRTYVNKRYYVERGAYHGTTDDRADRWYIGDAESSVVDRRGPGYHRKADAVKHARLMRLYGDGGR